MKRDEYNAHEAKVLGVILSNPETSTHAADLARICFPGVRPFAKAHSWVRNAVRRPIRDGLIVREAGELAIGVGALELVDGPLEDDVVNPSPTISTAASEPTNGVASFTF